MTSRPPQRQQVRIDRQLNQIGFLLRALTKLVIDDFQLVSGAKSDRIYSTGDFDTVATNRQANSLDVLFHEHKDILPILKTVGSLLEIEQPLAVAAHPLGERDGLRT